MARKIDFGQSAPWIPKLVDMHGVDFNTGVGEEAVYDQHDAGELRPRRQEMMRGHRRGRVIPLKEIRDAQRDEDRCRDQRPDQGPC